MSTFEIRRRELPPKTQYVVPQWFLWLIILGATVLVWFGCQQPFYLPYGNRTICPEGQHALFDKNKGWICVQDSTPPDSTP
jgi:hypothetical protein